MNSTLKQGKGGTSAYYHAVEDGSSATRRRGCFQGWWWELTAGVATLCCMAAVVSILFRMQDRPAADWTFPINLNSTIAALVTAGKSTALIILASCVGQSKWRHFERKPSRLQDLATFDEASRGPLGAFKLLWRLRTRFGTAVVAALATIVALGVDSFAQQVVKLDQQTEMVEDRNATFWVTDTYSGGALSRAQSIRYTFEASTVDTQMQGAIYRGLYNIPSSVPFNCSSECQWDDTHFTLGFVSDCANVTKEALENMDFRLSTPGGNNDTANMTTPGNLIMHYNAIFTSHFTAVDLVGADLTPKTGIPSPAEFARIGVLQMKKGVPEAHVYELGTNNTEVFECTLSFAALEYKSVSASGGSLRIGERKVHRLGPGHYVEDHLNRTYVVYNTADLQEFRVSEPDLMALGAFFESPQFQGQTYDGETPPVSSGLGPAFLAKSTTNGYGVAAIMEHVAQSMTDQLLVPRAGDDGKNDGAPAPRHPVPGRSARATVYVRVHWVWLAVPLFVSAAAVALLVATVARTTRAGDALWKSSALAMLYHDLVPAPGEQRYYLHTDVAGLEHLEELTKGVKVGYK